MITFGVWLGTVIGYFVVLFFAILVHEIGHVYYFDYLGKKVDFKCYYISWRRFGFKTGTPEDHAGLTRKQKYNVSFYGIASGLAFIIFIALLTGSYGILGLIVAYLYGCARDIKNMYKLLKGEDI